MTQTGTADLEALVLEVLIAQKGSMTPEELIQAVQAKRFTTADEIRRVLWYLIDEHRLELQRDWRLKTA